MADKTHDCGDETRLPGAIDRACREFEHAWRDGDPPDIRAFAIKAGIEATLQKQLAAELVRIDIERRWRSLRPSHAHDIPERPRLEDYLARLPELGPAEQLPAELIEVEYHVRTQWGDRPDHGHYQSRFPQHFPALSDRLSAIDQRLEEHAPDTDDRSLADTLPVSTAGPQSPSALRVVPETTLGAMTSFVSESNSKTRVAAAGRQFGDYELLQEIARGGMGVVYKARQVSLNRIVALKTILSGQFASEEDVRRFYSEAEAAANLDHPGIVPIYEVGQHDGQHYFSMGFIDGMSASAKMADGPLPVKDAARLVREVAIAVQYAHEKGVIHRDLKPANILLDEHGQPRITDFGLAKRVSAESELTNTGQVLGTPNYMPPEQAQGDLGQVGPLSDVYGLGAILYAAITGRPPFQAASVIDILKQVVESEPVAPQRLNPALDRDVQTICMRSLSKVPSQRYPSAAALADDLDRWLDRRPILARPVSLPERLARWARRNPSLTTAIGLAITGLIVTLVTLSVAVVSVSRAARSAQQSESKAISARNAAIRLATEKGDLADREQRMRQTAERGKVRSLFEQSFAACRQRGASEGLFQLTRTLREAEQIDAADMEHLIRTEIAGWLRFQHPLLFRLIGVDTLVDVVISPHGDLLAAAGKEQIRIWRMDDGRMNCYPLAHPGEVKVLAFGADGRHLVSGGTRKAASASGDGLAVLWDVATGEQLGKLPHPDPVTAVAFAPDGRSLATGDSKRRAWIWNTERHLMEGPPLEHGAKVSEITFTPDGQRLLTACFDGAVRVWSRAGRLLGEPLQHGGLIHGMQLSQNGRLVLTTSDGSDGRNEVRLWDLETSTPRFDPLIHEGFVVATLSPDCHRILTGCDDKLARVWDARSGRLLGSPWPHDAKVRAVAFSPDGEQALTGCIKNLLWVMQDNAPLVPRQLSKAQVWRVSTGTQVGPPLYHEYGLSHVGFTADGTKFYTAGNGHGRVWQLAQGRPMGPPLFCRHTGFEHGFRSRGLMVFWSHGELDDSDVSLQRERFPLTFTTGNDAVATLSESRVGHLWQIKSGMPVGERGGISRDAHVARCNAQRGICALAYQAGERHAVEIRDMLSGERVTLPIPANHDVSTLELSPDGSRLAAALVASAGDSEEGQVRIWDTVNGASLGDTPPDAAAQLLKFSPDGELLVAVANSDSRGRPSLQFWDGRSGQPCASRLELPHRVDRIVFRGDGQQLLAWRSYPGECLVWNREPHDLKPAMPAFRSPVTAATFSPDGRWIATGSVDRTARLWDAGSGKQSGMALRHRGAVTSIAFNPDGSMLVTGSTIHDDTRARGELAFWHVATQKALGPPIVVTGGVVETLFSADGAVACAAQWDNTATCWQAPTAVAGTGEQIERILQHATGLRLDPNGSVQVLGLDQWLEVASELDTMAPLAAELFPTSVAASRSELSAVYRDEVVRAAKHEHWQQAAWYLDRLAAWNPVDIPVSAMRARAHFNVAFEEVGVGISGHFEGSWAPIAWKNVKRLAVAAIQNGARDVAAWTTAADAHFAGFDWEEAEHAYEMALEQDPSRGVLWHRLGHVRAQQHEFPEAIEAYTSAIERQPDEPAILFARGDAYAAIENWESAKGDFRRVLALSPGTNAAAYRLALVLLASNEVDAYYDLIASAGDWSSATGNDDEDWNDFYRLWTVVLAPQSVSKSVGLRLLPHAEKLALRSDDPQLTLQLKSRHISTPQNAVSRKDAILVYGALLSRLERYEEAYRALLQGMEVRNKTSAFDVEYHLMLGLTSAGLGRRQEARQWLSHADEMAARHRDMAWFRLRQQDVLRVELENIEEKK